MAEEFTAKFKVDISDLKKNISDANKQIKLANATFKAETAGMDNWTKNADGLSKKLKNLKDVLEKQKKVLESYKKQLERQKAAYDENGKRADELKNKLRQLAEQGVSKTDAEYQKFEKALKNVQKEQENNGKACDDLRLQILNQQGAVNKAEADIEKYDKALSDLEKEEKKSAEEAKRQKSAYEQLTDTVDKQETELKDLKQKYSEVVLEQGKDSKAAKDLEKDILNLSGELKANKKAIDDADRAADELDDSFEDAGKGAEQANSGFTAMKAALGDLVSKAIQAAINALKDLAKEAYNAWDAFDQGADNITALTGKTGAESKDLMNAYKNLGKNVKAEFGDIGTAVGEVSTRFGLSGDELETVAGQFLKFADINKTDVKTSIDNVQSAMAAWGISSEDTVNFLDSLNAAGQESGTSVDQLSNQLVSNSEALQELGFSASDSIKLLANLSKNGIDSSTAMAGFKKALQIATKSGKPLDTTMQKMYNSIAKAGTETQALQRATDLFGAKAAPALTSAIRDGRLSFEDFGTTLSDAQGSVENTYEAMQSGPEKIELALQNMKMQAAEMLSEIFEKYGPEIVDFIGELTTVHLPKIFAAIDWLIDHMPEISKAIGQTSPITNFVNAIYGIIDVCKDLKSRAAELPKWFQEKVTAPIGKFFTGLWDGVKQTAANAWANIKSTFANVASWFGERFSAAWENIKRVFNNWGSFFSGLWDNIKTTFTGLGTKLGEAIGGSVKTAINRVIGWIESTINRAIGLINGAIGVINAIPGVNIGRINTLSLPRLAKGGILKKGQVGLLEGSGDEAVVPLSQNKKWVSAIASEMLKQVAGNNINNNSIRTNNTNFTQNIYAPTAPSRIEIYRQTKNLLNLAQGGII